MSTVPCMRQKPRTLAEGSVIRSIDGGPEYQVNFAVTYGGCPAQGPSYASGGQPAEGPEWEITGIDGEVWHETPSGVTQRWVPIEDTHTSDEIDAVYGWAEMLDLSDEVEEAMRDEADAWAEYQYEQRRSQLEDW